MNPEEVVALWERIQEARAQGFTDAEINAQLPDLTGGQFDDVRRVQQWVSDPAIRASSHEGEGRVLQGVQGATFEFGDEIAGLLAGLGAAVVPGGRGFSEARREVTEGVRGRVAEADEHGGAIMNRIIGGAAVPGALLRSVAGPFAGLLTRGPLATPGGMVGRASWRAAAAGAGAGAIAGAGAAEGGPRDRAPTAATGAALGAATGLLPAAAISSVRQGRRAFRHARDVGPEVAAELRLRTGRGVTPPSVLRGEQKAVQREARESLIKPLEGNPAPEEVTSAFMDGGGSPEVARTLQAQLRAIQSRNPNARRVLTQLQEVAEGTRPAGAMTAEISFETADEMVRNMTGQARRAGLAGRAEEANALTAAFETLDEHLRTLPGYPEFKKVWAQTSANMRAITDGRKLAGAMRTADDVKAALAQQPTDEARAHLLDGMAYQLGVKLETRLGKNGGVSALLDAGPEFDRKMRQLFPDEASWNEFKRFVDVERASISFAEKARVVGQALAFLGIGSSIFARLLPTPGN